jgi:hypothetical protein
VLEQKGVGRLVSKELVTFNSREGINAATITVNLGPGTYTLSLYAAYDAHSHDRANSAKRGTREQLMFIQATTCKVLMWRTMSMAAMAGDKFTRRISAGTTIQLKFQPVTNGVEL